MPKRVMVFGTFDLLHYGHVRLLKNSKKLGGKDSELIVVIARDSSVMKIKKIPPIYNEDQRMILISELKPVDKAVLGYEGPDKLRIVEEYKPNIIVLGYDQKVSIEKLQSELKKRGLPNVRIIRLEKYGDPDYNSSTKIREKIIQNGKAIANSH
ncbi:MAG: FAD synthase [Candidatus Lokiarchaeota archaeon]|nr:FAD synthase [Candidatus Lokiarchaeota archaeon]